MKDIFIIGAKGMGNYGGYETFIDKLTQYLENEENVSSLCSTVGCRICVR